MDESIQGRPKRRPVQDSFCSVSWRLDARYRRLIETKEGDFITSLIPITNCQSSNTTIFARS